ncbi:MAG: hypothetical protein K2W78_03300 [Xanthobacteraceae bacterium]|nr:hypothetical protein [Xanthobacteraceae bacterium]
MFLPRLLTALCAVIVSVAFASDALAQQPPISNRVRGEILSVNGDILIVKSRDGTNVTMKMAPKATLAGLTKILLSDIKDGAYIGVTSVPATDGLQKATEVHVFPESMRGAGEGSRPWDTQPQSSMTNGGLDKMVENNDGSTLTVKYKGGEKKILVTPETKLVTFVPAEKSDLKPGAQLIAFTDRTADGALEASRITVGIDGLTPPM